MSLNNKKTAVDLIRLELLSVVSSLVDSKFFLLAVSGGKDSIVLLDAMNSFAARRNLKIAVAHFDHGLRQESEQEERFVRELCVELDIEFYSARAEPYDGSENMEAWARTNRYAFLEQIRQKIGADYTVTAHHKNDLAETVLMRVLSGRASISLGGIKKIDYVNKLFRPMLGLTREMIEKYVIEGELKYIEDSSNANLEITRNRIRTEIIPEIQHKINPGLVDSLCFFADRINADEESIWDLVNRIYLEAKCTQSCEFYTKQPRYIRWRLLKLELEKQLGKQKVGYNSLSRLSEAINTEEGSFKIIELGWGISCRFSRKGVLEFYSIDNSSDVSG